MKEEELQYGLHEKKRRARAAINQTAIGVIIVFWGSLLMLKQAGVIPSSVSTLPFVLTAFGALLILGGIYRLHTRSVSADVESP